MEAVQIVVGLLQVIAGVAPGVLAMVTGSESDEEAISKMQAATEKMPKRAGIDGAWAADLRKRKDADDT